MLRDVLSYVGLQSVADAVAGDGPSSSSPPLFSSPSKHSSGDDGRTESIVNLPRIASAPPHVQRMLAEHQAAGGPSIRLVIRGARRTGKTSLLSRMQGNTEIRSQYYPSTAIQAGVFLWRPRQQHAAPTSDVDELRNNNNSSASSSGGTSPPVSQRTTRVELWDVVDHGTASTLGTSTSSMHVHTSAIAASLAMPTDATTVDVYRHCHGVVFLFDITNRETFDALVDNVKHVPRHIPIAVCANFFDLVYDDNERAEVTEADIAKCLHKIPRAVTPLFGSLFASSGRGNNSSVVGGAEHEAFSIPPTLIRLSTKSGYGLMPLHKFTGVCAAFAQSVQMDNTLRACYRQLAVSVGELEKLNAEQNYKEFLEWQAEIMERKRRMEMSSVTVAPTIIASSAQSVVGRQQQQPTSTTASVRSAGRAKPRQQLRQQEQQLANVGAGAATRGNVEVNRHLLVANATEGENGIDESFFRAMADHEEDARIPNRRDDDDDDAALAAVSRNGEASAQRKRQLMDRLAAQSVQRAQDGHGAPPPTAAEVVTTKRTGIQLEEATVTALAHQLEQRLASQPVGKEDEDDVVSPSDG